MINDIKECYRILELDDTASLEEVKLAHREMLEVWNPGRFMNDVSLQKKAQEKLKWINLAYQRLSTEATVGGPTKNEHSVIFAGTSASTVIPKQLPPKPRKIRWPWRIGQVCIFAVISSLVAAVFSTNRSLTNQSVEQPVSNPSKNSSSIPFPQPTITPGYFSYWSTRDEVIAVQGTPTGATSTTFNYDNSSVEFDHDDRVIAWNNGSRNLKVELLPRTPVKTIEYFSLWSSKDDVTAVQGTPTELNYTTYKYDDSTVEFDDTPRVIAWNNVSKNLKAKLLPKTQMKPQEYFVIWSSKDEVLAVQGTPTKIDLRNNTMFWYDSSSVEFDPLHARVVSWNDKSQNLKTRSKSQSIEK